MSKSVKGAVEKPGKHVAAKSGLNRAILDQGWSAFRTMLNYKLAWLGGMLLADIAAQYTSQTCPHCGHVSPDNRKTRAAFHCVQCGYENNAGVVCAIIILERGYRLSACGDTPSARGTPAQEPTEDTQAVFA